MMRIVLHAVAALAVQFALLLSLNAHAQGLHGARPPTFVGGGTATSSLTAQSLVQADGTTVYLSSNGSLASFFEDLESRGSIYLKGSVINDDLDQGTLLANYQNVGATGHGAYTGLFSYQPSGKGAAGAFILDALPNNALSLGSTDSVLSVRNNTALVGGADIFTLFGDGSLKLAGPLTASTVTATSTAVVADSNPVASAKLDAAGEVDFEVSGAGAWNSGAPLIQFNGDATKAYIAQYSAARDLELHTKSGAGLAYANQLVLHNSDGSVSTSGSFSATTITATAAAGHDGFILNTAGARLHFSGTGTGDYLLSDGPNGIDSAGYLNVGTANTNALTLNGSSTGAPVSIGALGSEANIPINIQPKGTGTVQAAGATVLVQHAAVAQAIEIGSATLSAGNGTVTFATAFAAVPSCTCTDQAAIAAVKCVPTASTLPIQGTGTDVISWICVGAR